MVYQALTAFGSLIGGIFSGFLLSVLMVFVLSWLAGCLKDPVRLVIQGLAVFVFFVPGIVFFSIHIMSNWLIALGAVIPIVWLSVSLLRPDKAEVSAKLER